MKLYNTSNNLIIFLIERLYENVMQMNPVAIPKTNNS